MIEYVVLAVFTVAVSMLSYQIGLFKARQEHYDDQLQSVNKARKVRDTLNNPSVVDKLLQKYKR